ncbi:hypothetical protein GCM10022245_20470 [Streptomyces mayteni]
MATRRAVKAATIVFPEPHGITTVARNPAAGIRIPGGISNARAPASTASI